MRRLRQVQTNDRLLGQLQGNIAEVLAPLDGNPSLEARPLTDVHLLSGSVNRVPHKLGKPLTGWKLTRLRAQATVWDEQDAEASPHLFLALHTSADVDVDLEVF